MVRRDQIVELFVIIGAILLLWGGGLCNILKGASPGWGRDSAKLRSRRWLVSRREARFPDDAGQLENLLFQHDPKLLVSLAVKSRKEKRAMGSILDKCTGLPRKDFGPGTVLLSEGETSGRLYVLAEGSVEVLRGDTQVALVDEAGSVFGEMSVLLKRPHTATVRATTPVGVFVFEDAESFLKSNPEVAFFLGRLLAERLNAATTYLVDLRRQFEGQGNHLGMVGEVLDTLMNQQQRDDFMPGPEEGDDPRL
jgi:hypothetical protein